MEATVCNHDTDIALTPDHAGGAALRRIHNASLSIDSSDIINLDITQAANLSALSFTQNAPTQRHLTLRNTPALQYISGSLGDDQRGAVIHLDNPDFCAGLHVDMPVERIDAAWVADMGEARTFALEKENGYWRQVHLLHANTDAEQIALLARAEADDLIVMDFSQLQSSAGVWSMHTKAELVCLNIRQLQTLCVSGAQVLHVIDSDDEFSEISTDASHLMLSGLQQLSVAQSLPGQAATMQTLCIEGSQADSLDIACEASDIKLRHCNTVRLKLAKCSVLQVHSCPLIKQLSCEPLPYIELTGAVSNSLLEHARLAMNESIVRHNMGDIHNADDESLHTLLNMVPMQIKGRDLYPAMLVLQRAHQLGVDIGCLWQLRNQLNANHLGYYKTDHKRTQVERIENQPTPTAWRWKVRGDGCAEVWRIDVTLWAHALVAHEEHAKALLPGIGKCAATHDYACDAVSYLIQHNAQLLSCQQWQQLLKCAMKSRKRTSWTVNLFNLGEHAQKRFVLRLLKFAQSLDSQGPEGELIIDALKRTTVSYVLECFDINTAEQLITRLFTIHAPHARALCLQKSRQRDLKPSFMEEQQAPAHTRYLKLALSATQTVA